MLLGLPGLLIPAAAAAARLVIQLLKQEVQEAPAS